VAPPSGKNRITLLKQSLTGKSWAKMNGSNELTIPILPYIDMNAFEKNAL